MAAPTAACQAVWLRRLLGELTGVEAHPPALMVDNQPAIALTKNPVLHDRSKHIDVKFHFLRDYVDGWRSTPGMLVFLGSAPISWLSLK